MSAGGDMLAALAGRLPGGVTLAGSPLVVDQTWRVVKVYPPSGLFGDEATVSVARYPATFWRVQARVTTSGPVDVTTASDGSDWDMAELADALATAIAAGDDKEFIRIAGPASKAGALGPFGAWAKVKGER